MKNALEKGIKRKPLHFPSKPRTVSLRSSLVPMTRKKKQSLRKKFKEWAQESRWKPKKMLPTNEIPEMAFQVNTYQFA